MDLIPKEGRYPGEGNGNLLQYSCLENLKGTGDCLATTPGVAKNGTQLGMRTHMHACTGVDNLHLHTSVDFHEHFTCHLCTLNRPL